MTDKKNIPALRKAGHLAKQNLPGLMGRRDAAWDQAVRLTLLPEDEPQRTLPERIKICNDVVDLLTIAHHDTAAILQLLSSPDTENRERKLYSLQEITLSIAGAWRKLTALEQALFGADTILANFDAAGTEAENQANSQYLQETRNMLLAQIRHTFKSAGHRLSRYRTYTANSFSASYAERYKNAYSNYLKLYEEKYPGA